MNDGNMTRVEYGEQPPAIQITKATIDILLKQEKASQLLALYLFYCYITCWQKSLQIKATTTYTAKGLKWSVLKVRRVKKRLIALGLLKDVKQRNENHIITGHFIKVYFAIPKESPPVVKSHSVVRAHPVPKQEGKCLETGNIKCLKTNKSNYVTLAGSHKRDMVCLPFDHAMSRKLAKIILTKRNVQLNTSSWPNIFRQLRVLNKVSKDRIRNAMLWYAQHVGDAFVPVAYSAGAFREKFTRIEDAIKRSDGETTEVKYKKGPDGKFGFYEAPE